MTNRVGRVFLSWKELLIVSGTLAPSTTVFGHIDGEAAVDLVGGDRGTFSRQSRDDVQALRIDV